MVKASDRYHKWVEWSDADEVYIGRCPDLITGIHGDDPVEVFRDLCQIVDEVIEHLTQEGRQLPAPRTRPMQEVA
jgi:predicted RNase H-like HicB family nuclease